MRELVAQAGLASLPYFGLTSRFLAGKYRPGMTVDSARADGAARYLEPPQLQRSSRVLAVLDEVAAAHSAAVATVALAWLLAQPTVAAPIARARTTDKLADLLDVTDLELTPAELTALTLASQVN